jgi:hypothetical protein
MSFKTAKVTLAAAVATNGTITVGYPTGTNSGHYAGAFRHKAFAEGLQANLVGAHGLHRVVRCFEHHRDVQGPPRSRRTRGLFQFDLHRRIGSRSYVRPVEQHPYLAGVPAIGLSVREISLGAPVAGAANSCRRRRRCTAASAHRRTAERHHCGVDVPRNVVAAWTGTAVLTVTGKDSTATR